MHLSTRLRPSCSLVPPLQAEGAGNAACWQQPMARLQKKSRRQSPQVQPKTTGIPRAMVYQCPPRSPPGTGCLAPRRSDARQSTSNLASAPGCQNQTASPSANASFVGKLSARCDTIHVHRICGPTLVTIARRPSWKAETRRNVRLICPTWQVLISCDIITRRAVCARVGARIAGRAVTALPSLRAKRSNPGFRG
jgi:hypothetical protein